MPECEICGEDVTRVYTCKNCDIPFCTDCGSTTERLCIDCLEEQEEEDGKEDREEGF